jgi:preprotein translocase subunit YajC
MQPNPQMGMMNLVFMVLMIAVWYFILIRPQQKKQKEHSAMLDNLKKNTEVVTTSGIHGTITNVKDKTFVIRIDDNVNIEIEKNCIAFVKKTKGEAQ